MGAPLPEQTGLALVTAQANGVPFTHGRGAILGEGDHSPDAFATSRIHVGFAWAVAAFAPAFLPLIPGVLEEEAAHPRLGKVVERVLVALLAGLGADVGVAGLGRGRLGRRLGGDGNGRRESKRRKPD
jgi:hypothetical protein